MILIPGILISIATFPGVIVHEAAHMWFCKLRRVAVLDVCFFRFANPTGYVIHENTENFNTVFLVSVGPFIVNFLSYFLLWLGVSIGMHAFPSTGDAYTLHQQAKKAVSSGNILAIISFPLVVLIYLANVGRVFWLDSLYGLAIGLGLPTLIF